MMTILCAVAMYNLVGLELGDRWFQGKSDAALIVLFTLIISLSINLMFLLIMIYDSAINRFKYQEYEKKIEELKKN